MVFAIITIGVDPAVGHHAARCRPTTAAVQVATNLAAQAIDVARAVTDVVASPRADHDRRQRHHVHVAQTAEWITTTGVDATCSPAADSGNGSLFYKRLQVAVTWSGMRTATAPVRADTFLGPQRPDQRPRHRHDRHRGQRRHRRPGRRRVVTVEPDAPSTTPGKALTLGSEARRDQRRRLRGRHQGAARHLQGDRLAGRRRALAVDTRQQLTRSRRASSSAGRLGRRRRSPTTSATTSSCDYASNYAGGTVLAAERPQDHRPRRRTTPTCSAAASATSTSSR